MFICFVNDLPDVVKDGLLFSHATDCKIGNRTLLLLNQVLKIAYNEAIKIA